MTPETFGPLFDIPAGEASRDTGMALALGAELNEERIWNAIYSCALLYPQFTSDELWLVLGGRLVEVEHHNSIGASFNKAALKGIIQSTGRVRKSMRPAARRRNLLVWESLVWRGHLDEM